MFSNKVIAAAAFALCVSGGVGTTFGSVIMDWDASTWAGGAATWKDTAGGVVAVRGAGQPTKATAMIGMSTVDIIQFGGSSFDINTPPNPANPIHKLVGLQQFTISAVFRVTVGATGAGGENDFYNNNGITGVEIGGAGVGDWALGLSKNNGNAAINGGTGLASGDTGTQGPNVNDGRFHTAAFVVRNVDGTTFTQTMYLDGVKVGAVDTATYGGGSASIVNSRFSIGARLDGGNGFFPGDLARLQFDNTPLTAAQAAAQAANYLGETSAVPEPASLGLLGLGGLGLLARRRRTA